MSSTSSTSSLSSSTSSTSSLSSTPPSSSSSSGHSSAAPGAHSGQWWIPPHVSLFYGLWFIVCNILFLWFNGESSVFSFILWWTADNHDVGFWHGGHPNRLWNENQSRVKMLFVQLFTQTEKGQRSFGAQLRIFNDICFNKGFLSHRSCYTRELIPQKFWITNNKKKSNKLVVLESTLLF